MATQLTLAQLRKDVRVLSFENAELKAALARADSDIKAMREKDAQVPAKTSALEIQVGGSHYKNMAIQPVEYILANNLGFIEGNIIKYASRWQSKGGIKDLEKIKHFADLLIEDVRSKQESSGNTECGENRAQVGVKFNPSAFLAKELAAK